jgi:hypothetical protein
MNNKTALEFLPTVPANAELRVIDGQALLSCSISLLHSGQGERLLGHDYDNTSNDLLQVGPEDSVTITADHLFDVCFLLPDTLDWYVNMAPAGESMEAYGLELEYQSERNVLLVQPTECVSC